MARKTFTKWVSASVVKSGHPAINDIVIDAKDGLVLINLLNTLKKKDGGKTTLVVAPEPKAKNVYQMNSNQNKVIETLKADKVKIVNIGASDLVEQNEKLVLALIWIILCHYETEGGSGARIIKDMLQFVNEILKKHHPTFGVDPIESFIDDSIRDGRVFDVLNHHFGNDDARSQFKAFEKDPADKAKNFDGSLDDAAKHLNIPKLLDGEDMNNPVSPPDEKSVVAQVIQYKALAGKANEADLIKEALEKKLAAKAALKDEANQINKRIDDLLNWIAKTTDELNDNPADLHPTKIGDIESYNRNHFQNARPEKCNEYNQILSDNQKLRSKSRELNMTAPTTDVNKLRNNWGVMHTSEKQRLDYLAEIKSKYAALQSKKRSFDRKNGNLSNHIDALNNDAAKIEEMLKDINLENVQHSKVNNEALKANIPECENTANEIKQFLDDDVKANCPNSDFYKEQFEDPLAQSVDKLGKLKGRQEDVQKAVDEADSKFEDVSKRLNQNALEMSRIQRGINADQLFVGQLEPYKTLDECLGDFKTFDEIKPADFKARIEECRQRDAKNTEVMGKPVPNPYTSLAPDQLDDAAKTLEDKCGPKKEQLEAEKERLSKLDAQQKKFEEAKRQLNAKITANNDKLSDINEQDLTVDDAQKKLTELKTETAEIGDEVDKLAKDYADVPEIGDETHALRGNVDGLINAITDAIEKVLQKPNIEDLGVDAALSKDEENKITTEFKKADKANSGKLNFDNFYPILVSLPPLGLSNINEASPEVRDFFKTHSAGETITLPATIAAYASMKEKFVLRSQDQVFNVLKEAANADGLVPLAKLTGMCSSAVLDKIKAVNTPVDVGGEPHYALNDLM